MDCIRRYKVRKTALPKDLKAYINLFYSSAWKVYLEFGPTSRQLAICVTSDQISLFLGHQVPPITHEDCRSRVEGRDLILTLKVHYEF